MTLNSIGRNNRTRMKRGWNEEWPPVCKKKRIEDVLFSSELLPIITTQTPLKNDSCRLLLIRDLETTRVYKQESCIITPTNIKFDMNMDNTITYALHPKECKLAILKSDHQLLLIDPKEDYGSLKFDVDGIEEFKTGPIYKSTCNLAWSTRGNYLWLTKANFIYFFDLKTLKCLSFYKYSENVDQNHCTIQQVHPYQEFGVVLKFNYSTTRLLEYNEEEGKILEIKRFDHTLKLYLDPFCPNWENITIKEMMEPMRVIKNEENLYIDMDGISTNLEKLSGRGSLGLIIVDFMYFGKDCILFTYEHARFLETLEVSNYACFIDFSNGLKNAIEKRWKSSNVLSWTDVLFHPTKLPKIENITRQKPFIGFHKLIDDCWRYIFSFLDAFDLLHISHVCVAWRKIVNNQIWKQLCFTKWILNPININDWKEYCLLRTKVESIAAVANTSGGRLKLIFPTKYNNVIKRFIEILSK